MKEYLYIRVEVGKADPNRANILSSLVEKTTGKAVPDVIPHTDPGAIVFRHARVVAASEDEAYDIGFKMLPEPEKGTVINDYVVLV